MDTQEVLLAALSPNNATRAAAEAELSNFLNADPGAFFKALSDELANDNQEDAIRQLAGIQMKVYLDSQDDLLKRERRERWAQLDEDIRNSIKENVTAALGSDGDLARSAAALVVSKIGVIEIHPDGNAWPDLIAGLCGMIERTDLGEGPRSAGLMALGYLLEELDEYAECPLVETEIDNCLTAICGCMDEAVGSVKIQQAAATAMFNALPFVANIFEDPDRENERNVLMMAICNAAEAKDDEVKMLSLQSISRIAELYYAQLENYMKDLAELTATAARNPEPNIVTAALDFWAMIANEEAEMRKDGNEDDNKGYILTAIAPLVDMVFDIMCQVEEEDSENEFGPAEAASAVLKNAALAVGPVIVDTLMKYINTNLRSPSWQKRDAAVLSFALILEDSVEDQEAKAKLQAELIHPALPHLLDKLVGPTRDAHHIVRSSTAFALGNVFEYHIEVVDPDNDISTLIPRLVEALEDEPRTAKFVAMALNNLIESLNDHDFFVTKRGPVPKDAGEDAIGEAEETIISEVYYDLIDALMTRADNQDADQFELRTNCYSCISTIIEAAGTKEFPILLAFLKNCLERIEASLNKNPESQEERDYEFSLQDKIIGMISALILRLESNCLEFADDVTAIIVHVLSQQKHPATSQVLITLSHLAHATGSNFGRYMEHVYPLLLNAMKNHADTATCERAVMAIGDIARVLTNDFLPVADEVLEVLRVLLVNTDVMRSIKPPAFDAFSEITLAIGSHIDKYLPSFLMTIKSAAEQPIPKDDEDAEEYILEVRRSCMTCYSHIFQAYVPEELNTMEKGQARTNAVAKAQSIAQAALLPKAIPDVTQIIEQYADEWFAEMDKDENWAPDYALLRKTVSVIGDSAVAVGRAKISPYFTQRKDVVKFLVELEFNQWNIHHEEDDSDDSEASFRDFVLSSLPA